MNIEFNYNPDRGKTCGTARQSRNQRKVNTYHGDTEALRKTRRETKSQFHRGDAEARRKSKKIIEVAEEKQYGEIKDAKEKQRKSSRDDNILRLVLRRKH